MFDLSTSVQSCCVSALDKSSKTSQIRTTPLHTGQPGCDSNVFSMQLQQVFKGILWQNEPRNFQWSSGLHAVTQLPPGIQVSIICFHCLPLHSAIVVPKWKIRRPTVLSASGLVEASASSSRSSSSSSSCEYKTIFHQIFLDIQPEVCGTRLLELLDIVRLPLDCLTYLQRYYPIT